MFLVVLGASLAAAFAGYLYARFGESRRQPPSSDSLRAGNDERLTRIEQTLEAVAIEVERIGEMERFSTALLASRQAELDARTPMPMSTPPKVITPH